MAKLKIDVWSDYVCPFCYVELPVLDRIQLEFGGQVEIEWHSFELYPASDPDARPNVHEEKKMFERKVIPMARDVGLKMRFSSHYPRTRMALEAAEFARIHGKYDQMHRAIFRAYYEEGQDIGRMPVLLDLARLAGLEPKLLREALRNKSFQPIIEEDEALADELELDGVPALIVTLPGESLYEGRRVTEAVGYSELRGALNELLREAA
ncbi:MAG: DsbA family protein [Bdellovibrionia bacterium]